MIPGEPDIVFAAADSDVHGDVQDILQQGIRMSREKRELIRTVYEMSVLPDHSFRTLERVLREKTILREHSIGENSRQYFRSLSARERENWADFVRDLLRDRETGEVSPEQVYLRMNGGQAAAAGIDINPWPINQTDWMEMCCKAHVNAMITDYPDRALRVAEAMRQSGGVQ